MDEEILKLTKEFAQVCIERQYQKVSVYMMSRVLGISVSKSKRLLKSLVSMGYLIDKHKDDFSRVMVYCVNYSKLLTLTVLN